MAKRYEGIATIELTNVRTGKKRVQVEKNIVTNAIYNIVSKNPYGAANYSNEKIAALMSGVMLFDDTINENAGNIDIPKTPIAWASDTLNTHSDLKRGSINNEECRLDDNGFTLVWEFGTSQGNGTTKCIGLGNPNPLRGTNFCDGLNNGGIQNIFYPITTSFVSGTDTNFSAACERPIYVDAQNGYFYSILMSNDGTSMTINKGKRGTYKIWPGQVNACGTYESAENKALNGRLCKKVESNNVSFDTSLINGGASDYTEISVSYHDGFLYIFTVKDNTNYVLITKINLSDYSVTQETKTYANILFYARSLSTASSSIRRDILCFNYPYLYPVNYNNPKRLYKIDITDETSIEETTLGDVELTANIDGYNGGYKCGNFFISPNCGTYKGTYNYARLNGGYILDLAQNKISYISGNVGQNFRSSTGTFYHNIDNFYTLIEGNGRNGLSTGEVYDLFLSPFYLATINNVTPFEKTASDTLKITYTIRELEE